MSNDVKRWYIHGNGHLSEKPRESGSVDLMEPVILAADFDRLLAERNIWRENMHDAREAFDAMRIDLNELFGDMASPEASLRHDPTMVGECVDIVDSAHKWAEKRDETIRRQANTIAFFASVIKSGESWTEQCDAALKESE